MFRASMCLGLTAWPEHVCAKWSRRPKWLTRNIGKWWRREICREKSYLAENVHKVVLQKSILTQIRQLIPCCYWYKAHVDDLMRELTFTKRPDNHFLWDKVVLKSLKSCSNNFKLLKQSVVATTYKSWHVPGSRPGAACARGTTSGASPGKERHHGLSWQICTTNPACQLENSPKFRWGTTSAESPEKVGERDFFIDNLLVRIHLIIEMILVDRPCATGVWIPVSR